MTTPENNIYGQDPGDASVEHSYAKVQEKIRWNLHLLKTYPNETLEEKAIFLTEVAAPEFEIRTARKPSLLQKLLKRATANSNKPQGS